MAEKTEQATPQKLQEARKKGQISQSQDVPKLLVMLGVMEIVFAMMDDSMARLQALMSLPLQRLDQPFTQSISEVGGTALVTVAVFFLLTVGVIILLRILGGWIQFGPLFATEALALKFEALNPAGKLKEMFSARQFVQLLTSLLKAVILGFVFWLLIEPRLPLLASLASGTLEGFWQSAAIILKALAHTIIGVLLIFAITDFALQKYFYLKQNRMSHDDIKNEYKQNEGDPHTKGHRRSLARQLANSPPKKAAPKQLGKADVLLVNPTHFAVGLYYQPDETPLPLVLFKAEDKDAQALIAQAHQANIPVIRYIWLTRTLYRTVEEGQFVPRETLQAVAQIYRVLRSLEHHIQGELIEFEE